MLFFVPLLVNPWPSEISRTPLTRLGYGPVRAGYRTDLWTLPRVAAMISQHFGVGYHPAHVWKLLTGLGWSCQKPERRAVEQDEPAIARWKRTAGPRIKKRLYRVSCG